MAKYKSKSVVCDAIQYNGNNAEDIAKFIGSEVFESERMKKRQMV